LTDLSNYDLSPLRTGDPLLLRGRRDGLTPILVVAPGDRNGSVDQVKRLEHEYSLRAELDAAWAARPIALTRFRERPSLVLEDPGGEPLDQLCGRPWDVSECLRTAIPLASALRLAHDRGIVHEDIRPANILVDVARGGAWLTGFGIATRAPRERPNPDPPEVIAGTLAYMAPEQTGRMDRSTDSRSDLYGLGIILYEMLTGAPPFTASDPMEMIHCQIAQQPIPPSERASAIPRQLSGIVMKLLAKPVEERYQTAASLEADLRRCLSLYDLSGRIDPFPLGALDVPDRLVISESWGAEGKVRQFEQLYPNLRQASEPSSLRGGAGALTELDIGAVLRASQALSSEIQLPELIGKLVRIAMEHAGAERGLLVLQRDGRLKIEAIAATGREGIEVTVKEIEVTASDLPLSMLHYVIRTREGLVIDDASTASLHAEDDYVRRRGVRSALCLPIINQANLIGALYLENNLTPRAFAFDRVAVLEMLAAQAAISLENARLYSDLQQENNDRRRVEEDLRRSEAYLHEAQRLGRMGSFVLEPSSGRMVASAELIRILGRDPNLQSTTLDMLREHIHPEDRQLIEQQRNHAIEEKLAWTFGYRIVLADGIIKFVESAASPVIGLDGEIEEYVGIVIDVTEYKMSEQKLRMNQALLSEAQRLSRTGSYTISGPDGNLTWTGEMYRIYEYDPTEEPTVQKAVDRIHPEDRGRLRDGIRAALDARSEGFNADPVEYRLLMPDGRLTFISSVRGRAGPEFSGVATVVGATMDVTDRRNAQEALLRAQADLAHVSRVNTMGELTAILAHEVNQPISAAVTNANACLRFLSGESPDLQEAREAASAIVHAGTRAAEIVSRTREFFRKGVPEKALVDVDDLIRGTVVLLESQASRYSVSMRMWLAAGAPAVMGDRVQLQQVIVNLIMNGIDAMREVDGVRELAIRTARTENDEIVVSFTDSGLGLPAQGADRIFHAFFTTKSDGTGMGLSISRSIVEAHGGRIWAEPAAPRGATFHFALPVADESQA
jgi:signal transduction histidine kinase/GAF domain-containing protein